MIIRRDVFSTLSISQNDSPDPAPNRRPRLAPSWGLLALLACLVASPAAAQDLVLAFGDSITHGLGDSGVSCTRGSGGYPPRLRNSLNQQGRSVQTRTFGVCGERTGAGLSRLNNVLSNNAEGDVVLIMEGTNDLSDNNTSVESVRFNLNAMVDKVKDAGMVPVLSSVIPRAPEGGSNGRTGFLASLLRQDAIDRDVVFADPYEALINVSNLFGNFYFDAFHPNSSGYGLLANAFVQPTQLALDRVSPPGPCVAGAETLCLQQGRFRVEVEFVADGNPGVGQAVPLTSDTGFFWFFNKENLELVVKVLDGRDINGNFWVFYGGLSDVEYTLTVTDSETGGRKIYQNPNGTQASVGDTAAFPSASGSVTAGAGGAEAAAVWRGGVARLPAAALSSLAKMDCETDDKTFCAQQGRFSVTANWTDFEGATGAGTAVSLTDETGYFWFFNEENIELVVKVLDGTSINGSYWVFYGALTNVAYDIAVTDTTDATVKHYVNPIDVFGSGSDLEAFTDP